MTQKQSKSDRSTRINRRKVLAAAGAAGAGLAFFPTSVSAHAVFYGCSQVCTHGTIQGNPHGNRCAVVLNEDTGDCRLEPINTQSNRNDPPIRDMLAGVDGENVYCYEVDGNNESVVGMCISGTEVDNPDEPTVGPGFWSNGNCAAQKPDCANEINCEDCSF